MATSTDSNKGDEEVAASYAAEPLEILFNSKYILDLQDVVERKLPKRKRGFNFTGIT